MFDNVGGTLKGLAKIICWLGIILFVIFGLVQCADEYADDEDMTAGFLTSTVGSVVSWLSSLGLYAFGELVERVSSIDEKLGANKAKADSDEGQ